MKTSRRGERDLNPARGRGARRRVLPRGDAGEAAGRLRPRPVVEEGAARRAGPLLWLEPELRAGATKALLPRSRSQERPPRPWREGATAWRTRSVQAVVS